METEDIFGMFAMAFIIFLLGVWIGGELSAEKWQKACQEGRIVLTTNHYSTITATIK